MTKNEIISELKSIDAELNMSRKEFCREQGIKDGAYWPYMAGRTTARIKRIIREAEEG